MKKPEELDQTNWSYEFQEIYILTYNELYGYTNLLVNDDGKKARELFISTYAEAYQRKIKLPSIEKQMVWLKKVADNFAETKMGIPKKEIALVQIDQKKKLTKGLDHVQSDIDIASVFLEIEDRIAAMEMEEEQSDLDGGDMSKVQVIFSATLVLIAVFLLVMGMLKVKEQLDVLREPFLRSMASTDVDGLDLPAANIANTKIKVGGKAVVISNIGEVLYSLPLEEAGMDQEPVENPEIQKQTGWTYYLPCPERVNTQLGEVASPLHHALYRIGSKGDEIQIIAREVDDYLLWEDGIYVSQFGRIQRLEEGDAFETMTPGIYTEVKGEEVYLQDILGKPLKTQADGTYLYEDRVFKMSSNRIDEVSAAPRIRDHISYYLKEMEDGSSKKIYRSVNGQEELFVEQGQTIDSICIAGDWLYYSAYMRRGGSGAHYSEIYRKSLVEDNKPEKLREEFTGRIFQMYFSEEENQIYGNYIPKNWKSNHGVIAVISLSGQMSYLEDKALRSEEPTSGNDMLEFIMAKDGQVYCYWMDCIWKKGEDPIAIWRKVLVIPGSGRVQVEE